MRLILNIIGILMLLAGVVFFLMGVNVLPTGFMTGSPQSAINGTVFIILAFILIIWANRR